jgi:uncharacterized membrane protein YbhN (UPF0104 family)
MNYQKTLKNTFSFGIKLLVTLALMTMIFRKVNVNDMTERLYAIHTSALIWVFILLAIGFLLSVYRWHSLIATTHPEIRFSSTLRGLLLERFLNQAIPTTISGDIARTFVVVTPRFSFAAGFLSVVVRIYALWGLGILVLILSLPLSSFIANPMTLALIALAAASVTAGGFLILFMPMHWITYSITLIGRVFTVIHRLTPYLQKLIDLRHLYANKKSLLFFNCILLTIIVHLVQLRAFQIIIMEMGATSLNYWTTILLVTPAFFLATLPLSVSGWGLREVGVIFMLAQIGISADISAGASILFGLAFALFGLCCGSISIAWSGCQKIYHRYATAAN